MKNFEIVEKAIAGDESAITQLYNETYQTAYAIAVSMLKDENEAFDILQEAYISAFNNLENLQDKSKFNSWLNHIVSNKCKDYFRKKRPDFLADNTYSTDEGEIEVELEDKNLTFSPEENVDYGETKRLMAEMLNNLPDDQRMVILMYYMQDMSIKEIAEILDVSENTVKSRMNYGKKKLKSQVEDLEKKGTKLYGISGLALLPFIAWLLRSKAKNVAIPNPESVTSKLSIPLSNTNVPLSTPISNSMPNNTVSTAETVATASHASPYATNIVNEPSFSPYASDLGKAAAKNATKKAAKGVTGKIIALILAGTVAGTSVGAALSPKFRHMIDVFDIFKGPDEVIYQLEDAFNSRDVNSMLECFSPKFQAKYKLYLGIANGFSNMIGFGSISDGLFDGILSEGLGDYEMDFEVIDIKYIGDSNAIITVEVTDSDSSEIETETVEVIKVGDKWYLSDKYTKDK